MCTRYHLPVSRCVFAVVLFSSLALLPSCRGRSEQAVVAESQYPSAPVLIISIDTLRADHLPAFGYRGVRTPHLDALRSDSLLFTNAYSHVPLTLPSHISMLTGLLPGDHGVRDNLGFSFDADRFPTIPSLLKQKGYATGAAVSAYVLRGSTGLGRAFDFYDDSMDPALGKAVGRVQRTGSRTRDAALRWVDSQKDAPFFFFLHLYEPHTPYDPPEPFRSSYLSSPYDGEIADVDSIVGDFLDHLKKIGVYDRAVIILMSDHGEGLGDHGEQEHGIFLYQEDIHVPLILKLPKGDGAGTTVEHPVQLIDILPTITGLTGASTPSGLHGSSLLAVARGSVPDRSVFSETMYPRIHLGWSELSSLVDASHHFIEAPRAELYDVRHDRGEKKNIIEEQRRVYAAMKKTADALQKPLAPMSAVNPEEAAKLAALGYLGSGGRVTGPLPDPKDRISDLSAYDAAVAAALGQRPVEAIALLKGIVQRNPAFSDAWSVLAKTYADSGRYEDAIASYEKQIALMPEVAGEIAPSVSSAYLNLGDLDKAESFARLALTVQPGAAHLRLARIALSRGDLQRAEGECRSAMAESSTKTEARVLLAQIYGKEKRFKEALSLVDQISAEAARERWAPVPMLQFAKGDILVRMQNFEGGVAAFREEIRLFPEHKEAYANLAAVLYLQGRREEARQTMEALVRANPTRSARLLAARTFEALHDPELAATWKSLAGARPAL